MFPIIGGALLLYMLSKSGSSSSDGGSSIPAGSATDYIKRYLPYAKSTETYYGVPAVFTLAQGGLESGWGTSSIARNAKNHFGIKADSSWYGPKYGSYRAYDDVQTGFDDHGKFLATQPRYSQAFMTTDPVTFAKAVSDAGYSENPDYFSLINKVMNTVNKVI